MGTLLNKSSASAPVPAFAQSTTPSTALYNPSSSLSITDQKRRGALLTNGVDYDDDGGSGNNGGSSSSSSSSSGSSTRNDLNGPAGQSTPRRSTPTD